jgi:hypothetical protein
MELNAGKTPRCRGDGQEAEANVDSAPMIGAQHSLFE